MKNSTKILMGLLCLGLCCSLFLNFQRHKVEQANTQVETVMEYGAIERLAEAEGISVKEAVQAFKDRGVTTLAVFDTNLEKLKDKGYINTFSGQELLAAKALGTIKPTWEQVLQDKEFAPNNLYISEGTNPVVFAETEEDLKLRLGNQRVRTVSANPKILAINADLHLNYNTQTNGEQDGLTKLPLGISSEEMKKAAGYGFMLAVRPTNYVRPYSGKAADPKIQIAAFFKRLDKSKAKVSLLMGSGREMLGNKEYLPEVAKEMEKRDLILAMPEGVTQLQFIPMTGMTDLAKVVNYKVARTYVIDFAEQRKMQVYDAFRRWALSDEERNIRVNYIKTFTSPRDGKTLMATNLDYVGDVVKSVAARGYKSGRAGVFAAYEPNKLFLLPIAFAVMAGVFTYLGKLCPYLETKKVLLTIIFGCLSSAALFVPSLNLSMRHALALLSAVTFPVLTISYMVAKWEENRAQNLGFMQLAVRTSLQLCLAVLMSLIGASFLAAILGDIRFFLEMDIYRGVKLTFILPVVMSGLLFCKDHSLWEGDDITKNPLKRIAFVLDRPFNIKLLAALGVLGFIAYIFVGRSGHTAGVPVPAIEIKLRLFLERVMYARPREKEFLVGHPAFFLAAWAAAKRLPNLFYCLLVMGATIGQGSLVQTFAHMRTPIIMSYIRAFDGLALGLVLGLIALGIFSYGYPTICKAGRRLGLYE